MGQRMFVAAVPPAASIEELDEFLAVRRDAAEFRWVRPEQWHVTLAFLESVPDRAYDDLVDRLAGAAASRFPLRGRLSGGGAFPDATRAKVLWSGVEVDDPAGFSALAAGCRAAASTAGVRVDGQRFRPHLTLARLGRPIEATRWVRILDSFRGGEFELSEIALVASYLGEGPAGRPRYEVMRTFGLGPATGPGEFRSARSV